MRDECGNCGQQYTTDTCDECDGEIIPFEAGYVCVECELVVVEDVTGWQILSERFLS